MNSFVLNLIIAFTWLLLQVRASFPGFVVGFLIGFALIKLFPGVLDSRDYIRRTTAVAMFVLIFTRQFLVACGQLVSIVLFQPISRLHPRIITYDTRGLTTFEIILLSHCISLTPGSSCVGIAEDRDRLVLHVLNSTDPDAVRREIDQTLRRGILAMTR
jgi:Multisubunit Na+/H+ antiporter, MnhE subunit